MSSRIYTRTGDDGTTSLFGGDRVEKGNPRIDAYGTVDETNSMVGMARSHLLDTVGAKRLDPVLATIQEDLFVVGADLATPLDATPIVPRVKQAHVDAVEDWIDEFDADLDPLKKFVLPGGCPSGAALHAARTVCRRAERLVVDTRSSTSINDMTVVYLNRLSDLLFVLARWINKRAGVREDTWIPNEEE